MKSRYYIGRERPSDELCVSTYLKYESQIKAAEELGCSREMVARAVRRAGIPLTGRIGHKGNNGGGSERKITDAELIEEAKTMTRQEIAEKHNMCVCNVDRKLSRLGIRCFPARFKYSSGVKDGGSYALRIKAAGFGAKYDKSVKLSVLIKKQHGICQICGGKIDETDKGNGTIGNQYPTIDHIIPISLGGSHTWDNVQLAHMICNSRKGVNAAEVI
jgi:hypothetical protein